MKTMSISEARKHLPTAIEEVGQSHTPLILTRYGTPVAAITPYQESTADEVPHSLRGHPITVADDFDGSDHGWL